MTSALVYVSACDKSSTESYKIHSISIINLRNLSRIYYPVASLTQRGISVDELSVTLSNALRGYKFIFTYGVQSSKILNEVIFMTEKPILNLNDFGCQLGPSPNESEILNWCEKNPHKINLLEATTREKTYHQFPHRIEAPHLAEDGFIYLKSKFENNHLLCCVYCSQLVNINENILSTNLHRKCFTTCILYPITFHGYDFNY